MLASMVDSKLSILGKTRPCLVKKINMAGLGFKDKSEALRELNTCLKYGTDDDRWLQCLAESLGLDQEKLRRANRVTLLMRNNRAMESSSFSPYIELVLDGMEQPDSLMLLTKEQWSFRLPSSDDVVDGEKNKDFSLARKRYKQIFIENKGRCLNRRINGFRYFWAEGKALEFDVYGRSKKIVALRAPPKKRFVSQRVLRAVGKPKLLVIHS